MSCDRSEHHDPADEHGVYAWTTHVSGETSVPIFLRTSQILGIVALHGWEQGPTRFLLVGGSHIDVNGQAHYWRSALKLAELLQEQRREVTIEIEAPHEGIPDER